VQLPEDLESLIIVKIFFNTPYEYNTHGLVGFKYEALKDSVKWSGLRKKTHIPILLQIMTSYIKGLNSKK